jgi:hypothetical protein
LAGGFGKNLEMGEFVMSDKKDEDTGKNKKDKKDSKISAECLSLMRFNYENLDRAVWKAHQMSWLMTSIFVPIIFTGLGFLLKEFDKIGVFSIVAGSIVAIGVTWFWYAITRILAGYNIQRFEQLRALEEKFNEYFPEEPVETVKQFVQYRSHSGQHHRLRFKYVTLWFAIFLSFVSIMAAMAKMILWTCKMMSKM